MQIFILFFCFKKQAQVQVFKIFSTGSGYYTNTIITSLITFVSKILLRVNVIKTKNYGFFISIKFLKLVKRLSA
jgi:hypothetical protein